MGRSGYDDDYDDSDYPLALYRGTVRSAFRGKRGRAFMRELLEALDAMPEKRLIVGELQHEGAVCAIGSVGAKRGTRMDDLDVEAPDQVAKRFGIAECMVREIEFNNDDDFAMHCSGETPEKRWARVRAWVAKNVEDPSSGV